MTLSVYMRIDTNCNLWFGICQKRNCNYKIMFQEKKKKRYFYRNFLKMQIISLFCKDNFDKKVMNQWIIGNKEFSEQKENSNYPTKWFSIHPTLKGNHIYLTHRSVWFLVCSYCLQNKIICRKFFRFQM